MSERQTRNERAAVTEDRRLLRQLVDGTKYVDEEDGKEHIIFGDTFVPVTDDGKQEAKNLLQPTQNLIDSNVSDYGDGEVKTERYATNTDGVFLCMNFYKKAGTSNWEKKLEGYTRLGGE